MLNHPPPPPRLGHSLLPALWICPFRPFFLATALSALVGMALWLAVLAGWLPAPDTPGGPVLLHAHEMIFGFAAASIAGFLLTAVVEFTGCPPIGRPALRLLALIWLAGRLGWACSGVVGLIPAATADLGFMGLLLFHITGPLWRSPQRRHLSFFHSLLALGICHAGFYTTQLRGQDALPWLHLATGMLMILIVVALSRISMRLVNDVLEAQGGMSTPYLARPPRRNLAIFAIGLFSVSEFARTSGSTTGWLALAAAAAVLNLLNDWHVGRALFQRWVFIAYLVYWCMGLGYALIGVGLLGGQPWGSAGRHLLLAGALGLASYIVMVVAGRMHSGWGLDPRPWVPAAALLILLAALARSLAGLPAGSAHHPRLILIAGSLWLLAWGLYLARSFPVLALPRPDGRQGCDDAVTKR
ncbi:NnrS family protein [Zoogloea sp.]|uniref:NnrS family protein n=1 Tax=Zoogloea sp. TaxID=49181 RepID=UPI001ACE7718|nr:NnrS family protein [Zoogloea sp.]MBN8284678.1 NnrS family protein [Zoogloea sp.]